MNATVEDLRATIIPKSDQLNADQLVTGPMDITVTEVRIGSTDEQPIIVHYQGDAGRPFKPCKTMRRVLILGWGADGREWAGKSMRLYHDGQVRFGGAEVGGIRIRAMSHIPSPIKVNLSATKGKKTLHQIEVMEPPQPDGPTLVSVLEVIKKVKGQKGKTAVEALIDQLPFDDQIAATEALDAHIKGLQQ